MKNNILVVSEGGEANLGDTAILYSIINLLKDKDITVDCWNYSKVYTIINKQLLTKKIKSGNHKNIKSSFEVLNLLKKLIPNKVKWYLKNFKKFDNIKNCHSAIIGGGQLINGGNFTYSLYYWSEYFQKNNIPYYIMHVGCGSNISKNDFIDIKWAFEKSSGVYVRDKDSQEKVKLLGYDSCKLIPDVAFSISDFVKLNINDNIISIFIASYNDVIINLSEIYFKNIEQYFDYIINLIPNIEKNITIRITYSDIEQDYIDAFNFFSYIRIKLNVHSKIIFSEVDSLNDMLKIIASSKIIISSRLHPLIIGKSYDKKLIPVIISTKLKSFENQLQNESIDKIKSDISDTYSGLFIEDKNKI
jgi:polysaccharide pyruvyl transferase WcaK-like protein